VRASESSGNIGYSDKKMLVIDRLPPMVGGGLFYVGPQVITPSESGYIRTIVNVPISIAMHAVGGPIEIKFVAGNYSFPLRKLRYAGLWSGDIKFDKPGLYQMIAKSVDGAGNKTEQALNYFEVTSGGKVISSTALPIENARVEFFYKDFDSQLWIPWNGDSFKQKNPQTTDKNGEFSTILPPGTYFVKASAWGHRRVSSNAFTIKTPTVFNPNIFLKQETGLRFGIFSLAFPQLIDDSVELSLPSVSQALPTLSLVDSEIPLLTLRGTEGQVFDPIKLRGKKHLISFIELWSPPSVEQFAELEKAAVARVDLPISIIAVQETPIKASLFLERGNYKSKLFVDPDGETIGPYGIFSYPSNYVVDKSGKVVSIIRRILSKDEIIEILEN
jgi:hypothetical protein